MAQQPLRRILDQIQHLLETLRSTVVRIGNFTRRATGELEEQSQLVSMLGRTMLLQRLQIVLIHRQQEIKAGEVLCEATEHAVANLKDPASGQILRGMSSQDELELRKMHQQEAEEYKVVVAQIEKLGLDSLTNGELRQRAEALLSGSARMTENEAVRQVLYDNAYELNVLSGAGEGASPYQREALNLAREVLEIDKALHDIDVQFLKAVGWDNVVNERAGVSTPKQVDNMSPELRKRLANQRDELLYRKGLLTGWEGERRIRKSLRATLDAETAQRRAAEDEAEAERRAAEKVRNERIDERAEALATFKRTEW